MSGGIGILLLLLLFHILALPPPSSPATLAEKQALLDFKAGLSDPTGALASWTPSADPCLEFSGVTCDGASGAVQKILLHSSSLSGALPSSPSRLPFLQILSLSGNRLSGPVPQDYASIITLHKLNLSRNDLSGPVPPALGALPSLRLLDLSGNSLSGSIPPALFAFCARTRYVSLSRNHLSGPIPTSLAACAGLVGIDFSFNNLTGEFPPEICIPPGMTYVSLQSNSLSGTVAGKISGCRSLEFLDLGSNYFSGTPPLDLLALKNLSFFNFSANDFKGEMPEIGACSGRLNYIDASRNELSGKIDSGIVNCRELRFLDLGFNQLTGIIPPEIWGLKAVSILRLGNNGIIGAIPPEIGGMELLQILDLQSLKLTGEIPTTLSQCRFLLELDLSGNGLEGEIPDTIYNMTYLEHLDLHGNKLNGSIPATLGNLTQLQFLDLSENSLTGDIPDSLANLTQLTHFNVSYNNLTGEIPSSPNIQNFGPASFSHNPLLCGMPLDNATCKKNAGNAPKRTRVLSISAIVAIVATAVILVGVCLIYAVNILVYRKKKTVQEEILVSESTPPASTGSNVIIGKLVLFSKTLPSRYEDWEAGTKALLDKDCMIGGGSIGTVYRATLEGGVSIAVKKLETLGRIRNQDEFEQEIGRLGGLRHPNLVAFHGYYWSSTAQLMLYEFVPNGSLFEHLHGFRYSGSSSNGGRDELFWSRRFGIVLGTARALAYLHHDCRPQVLHLNIKSTNILLDEGFEAKLSDYGLGRMLPILGSYDLSKFHTAIGYVAPELASQSLRYSDKCDVFSFGVVLLEIVTGRKPVDSPGGTEVVVLRDYVRRVLEEGVASDCFDRRLRGFGETELIQVLKLGLICTGDHPSRRPSMAEVVQYLESIRNSS